MLNTGKQLREKLKQIQAKFIKETNISQKTYKHSESTYKAVSQTLKIILDQTNKYQQKPLKKLILFVGATGAGKSTLLNYIATGDDNFVVVDNNGSIKTCKKNVAEIGGESATTLYPNLYQCEVGTFLDCAGEGDTGGLLIQIVSSIIKAEISKYLKQVKVIFVASYKSLKGSGAYGLSFKKALDKNSHFMGDINKLKDNMGFVITGAIRKQSALKNAIENLQAIVGHQNNLNYKKVIETIIKNENVAVFSIPDKSADIGDVYYPPEWNKNQRQSIIQLIQNIPYGKIPSQGFFNISSNSQIRQKMKQALHVVLTKTGSYISKTVQNGLPIDIFSVEIQSFSKFINELAYGIQSDLSTFIEILSWNNYIKVKFDRQLIRSLEKQISFISKFCLMSKNRNLTTDLDQSTNRNWTVFSGLQPVFRDIFNDIQTVIKSKGNNFSKFIKTRTLKTLSASPINAEPIKDQMKQLYDCQQQRQRIYQEGKMQDSKYYNQVDKKQFIGTEKQAYKEKQIYLQTVHQSKFIPPQYEQYEDQVTKTRQVIHPKLEYKVGYQQKIKSDKKRIKVSTITKKDNIGKTVFGALLTGGTSLIANAILNGTPMIQDQKIKTQIHEIPTFKIQQKRVLKPQISHQIDSEQYTQTQRKVRTVSEGRWISEAKDVVKQRQVTKYRQICKYKDVKFAELDSQKYSQDLIKCETLIRNLRQSIQSKINSYPKGICKMKNVPLIETKDAYQEKDKDLLQKWQHAEYGAYFHLHPDQNLDAVSIKDIRLRLEKEKSSKKETDELQQQKWDNQLTGSPLIKHEAKTKQTFRIKQLHH